jgi:hypothetical protein
MLTDEQIETLAEQHLRKTYPQDCEIVFRQQYRHPAGVYFVANRRCERERYLGFGGFFVNRTCGEIWTFGSGNIFHEGLEYWLNFHNEGWRRGLYRLVVKQVLRPQRFAALLLQSQVSYVVL